jgi:hypothetical protein
MDDMCPHNGKMMSLEKTLPASEPVIFILTTLKVQIPPAWPRVELICERCRAGQMIEYQRKIASSPKGTVLTGRKCDRCGYTELDSDDDVWSAVGL